MEKFGKMCGDMGTFDQKDGDQFCLSIFGEDNSALLVFYFVVTTKSNCMRFTNYGCCVMWKNVRDGGNVWGSLAKQII